MSGLDERQRIADIIDEYAIDFHSIPKGEGHAAWYIAGRILAKDDPTKCPGGHGEQCCGHHDLCAQALARGRP